MNKKQASCRPDVLVALYELECELALPGLVAQLKKTPGAFEIAFDNWLDKQNVQEETNEQRTGGS